MTTLAQLLSRAVDLATESVQDGGGPFGAVVARAARTGTDIDAANAADNATAAAAAAAAADQWEVVAEGSNRVVPDLDPTAHAEVVALRAAAAAVASFDLAGTVLVASCEPCPMCLAASLWARVDAVWFAATRDDAAAAGFDDRAFYAAFDTPRDRWDVPVRRLAVAHPLTPFEAWSRHSQRVAY